MNISLFEISNLLYKIDTKYHKSIKTLLPILSKIDSAKISDKSALIYDGENISLSIVPKHYDHAELNLFISSRNQLILSIDGFEYYENHHTNEIDDNLLEIIEKYMAGIRVKEYCSKQGKVLKREYFFKDNSKIGTSSLNPFSFFYGKIVKEFSITFFSG